MAQNEKNEYYVIGYNGDPMQEAEVEEYDWCFLIFLIFLYVMVV